MECHRGHFPSCWHHAIGRKWGHPEVLAQLEFIGVCLSLEHLGLFWLYLPHPNLELHTVFFHGLLILQEKKFIIFLNQLDWSPKFQFRQNAWEQVRIRSTTGLFRPYLSHPTLESRTVFFHGLLILQGKLFQNFIIFLNRFDRSPKFQFRQNAWEQVQIRSTRACFGHISLIRTQNRAPFFLMDSLFFRENSVKIS